MKETENGSFELTKASLASIEALIADARGNATLLPDRTRIGFAAEYLRLAAQKSAALAQLLDAVSKTDKRLGDKASKRIREVDRAIEKFLDVVSRDNLRWSTAHNGKLVKLTGDQVDEFIDAVVNKKEIPAHLFEGAVEADERHAEPGESGSTASELQDDQSNLPVAHEDIREDTMVSIEVGAYQTWTEYMDLAYKKNGLLGVVHAAIEAVTNYDESATAADEAAPGCENMQRAMVARFMWEHFLPDASDELRKMPDGPFFWELANGGTTDFPKPGEVLKTAAETRKCRDAVLEKFEVYRATKGNVLPGFWDEVRTAAGTKAA